MSIVIRCLSLRIRMSDEPGVGELLDDVLADLDVLEQRAGELLVRNHPVRLPVVDDADAQAAGMNLLSHLGSHFLLAGRFRLRCRAGWLRARARFGHSASAAGLDVGTTPSGCVTFTVMWQVRLLMRDDASARAGAPALQRRALVDETRPRRRARRRPSAGSGSSRRSRRRCAAPSRSRARLRAA